VAYQKPGLEAYAALLLFALGWLTLGLSGCRGQSSDQYEPHYAAAPAQQRRIYIFGVHPLHNAQTLFEVYQPLIDDLNRHLDGAQIRLEASVDYAAFEKKLSDRHFHFALPNPYQALQASANGYRVFGKEGNDDDFRGLILVRKDSGIRSIADLRGKAISYPAPTALAAAVMPQWFLHESGLNVMKDIDNRYVGSQESSIMNVYLHVTAAGATWPPPWRAFGKEHPAIAAELEVKWQTPPLVSNALVVRDDVPAAITEKVSQVLFTLDRSDRGRAILAPTETIRFEPASDATYQPVRDFITRFEREVRPVNPQ
jgi:phosphonate transport system substrate-binding protein